MMLIDCTPLHNIIDEIKPNVARHYQEMTKGDDYGVPDMDWDLYTQLSHAGHMIAMTLKDAGNLVGYAVFSISRNQRYKNRVEASSEGLFVEQPYRSEWSSKFLKAAISNLKQLGVEEVNFTINDPRIAKWLARNGGKSTYQVWSF